MDIRRVKRVSVLLLGALVLASCGTTVSIPVTYPPEIDLGDADAIGVVDVVTPAIRLSAFAGADLFELGILIFLGDAFGSLHPEERFASRQLRNNLIAELAATGTVRVFRADDFAGFGVSRAGIETLRRDPGVPVDVFLVSEIVDFEFDDAQQQRTRTNRAGVTQSIIEWERTVIIAWRYELIDRDGRIIASGRIPETARDSDLVRSDLRSVERMIDDVSQEIAREFAEKLRPRTGLEFRRLQEDVRLRGRDADEFDNALALVDDREFAAAARLFEAIYQDTGSIAAGYNAAVLYERLGEDGRALALLLALEGESDESYVKNGVRRLEARGVRPERGR